MNNRKYDAAMIEAQSPHHLAGGDVAESGEEVPGERSVGVGQCHASHFTRLWTLGEDAKSGRRIGKPLQKISDDAVKSLIGGCTIRQQQESTCTV